MADVTRILFAIERGDPQAAAELLPLVYDELRTLVAARMAEERADHTLQPTALVHEAYVLLVTGAEPRRGSPLPRGSAGQANSPNPFSLFQRTDLPEGGQEKRHRLTVSVAPDARPLWADPVRLEQALVNLLTNAARYTEPDHSRSAATGPNGPAHRVKTGTPAARTWSGR